MRVRVAGGEHRAVVVPGPDADPARVEEALVAIERAHALIDHPRVPKVIERGRAAATPFLELACDAVADGVEVVRRITEAELRVPYEAADGLIVGARRALEVAHGCTSPATGEPLCLGRISYANFLFGADGRWSLVGFGRNFPLERDNGAPDGWVVSFHAPEIAGGGPGTPMGDYVALLLMMRSMLPFVDKAGRLARLLRGEILPTDAELVERLQWFDQQVVSRAPAVRPSMLEAVAVSDRIRELLGVTIDDEGFDAMVGALFARDEVAKRARARDARAEARLVVGPEARWIEGPSGRRHALGGPQRRIVLSLVERHLGDPEATLSLWDLLAAGWPGERPIAPAGANRVYVTLTRLRGSGLRDVIERSGDGYRLAPHTAVELVEAPRQRRW